MVTMVRLLLGLLCAVVSVSSMPQGAPDMVCDMAEKRPNHPFEPQSFPHPYEIGASVDSVDSAQENVTVRICSPPKDDGILGFLVLAYNEKNETFGQWQASNLSHPITCGVTHNDRNPKPDVTLIWSSPKETENRTTVIFKAVLVKDFSTFWINVPVPVMKDPGSFCNHSPEVNDKPLALPKN